MKYIYSLAVILSFLNLSAQKSVGDYTYKTATVKSGLPIGNVNSSSVNHYTNDKCLTHDIDQQLMQNSQYRLARESAKNITNQKMQEELASRAAPPVYTIPVIFHVIHEGEPVGTLTNISDAQIMSAIDALNRDYRRTSDDGGIAQGAGPDTEIQFCLASKDPSGNPHSGINRVNGTSVPYYSTHGIVNNGGAANESQVKNLSKWDNRYYLNIWVVSEINNQGSDTSNIYNFTGGTIGYAYLPQNPVTLNTNDGIVILHCSVGNDPNNNTPGFRMWPATLTGRTLTHEVGHFLGLLHPFDNSVGCTETNCSTQGDGICDTPPTNGGNTCSGPDCPGAIIENYMDYTSETCQDMFTNGQTSVMRAVLAGVRNELVTTSNCSPAVLTADFTANVTTVTTGGSVSFTDQSTGGVITSWSWNFGGGGTPNTSGIQNPTITFNAAGTYTVSLTVSDGTSNDTETKTSYIVVSNFDPLVCDTMTNINSNDVLTAYGLGTGTWGAYPGHNSLGIDGYAEPFTVSNATEVQKVIMPILQADAGTPTSSIDLVVYADNAGEPGTALGSQNILISDLAAGYYNILPFDNPISVNGNFWVGVEINYGLGDTVIFATADDRSPSSDSTTYFKGGGNWYSTNSLFMGGIATSMYLDVLTSGSPSVSFTETTLAINQGGTISFDASGSTNYSALQWSFVNGSPNTSTNVMETVTYNTIGTYDVTLYMLGGCRVDSLVKQVVVSNTTFISQNELNNSFSVYPNPTNDKLTLQFNDKLEGVGSIHLLDANGRIVVAKSINEIKNYSQVIEVNGLAKGVYQLRVNHNSSVAHKKIIIN